MDIMRSVISASGRGGSCIASLVVWRRACGRRRRALRPMAEGLEVRSLLSVGLDPSFGLGGSANLNLAIDRRPRKTRSRPSEHRASERAGGGRRDAGDYYIEPRPADSLAVARLTTGGSFDTTFNATGIETIPQLPVSSRLPP